MFEAYWQFISPFDWIILSVGTALMLFQLFAIFMRYASNSVFFVQHLAESSRPACNGPNFYRCSD